MRRVTPRTGITTAPPWTPSHADRLHRNGYAGMQRYASFLWSGDTFSTWGDAPHARADGKSFAHRIGAWTGLDLTWHDTPRRLTIRLAKGSRPLPTARRPMIIQLATPKNATVTLSPREITFEGRELTVTF